MEEFDKAQLDVVTLSLKKVLREDHTAGRKVAYLLPSTRVVIEALRHVLKKAVGLVVVGSFFDSATAPSALLARVRSGGPDAPRQVVIFSDQLLAPEVATLPVELDGVRSYFSGLEAVLHARYGFDLRIFVGVHSEHLVAAGTVDDSVAAVQRYLSACGILGDNWLMRERQVERTHEHRVRETRLRLRYFQSSVFRAFCDAPMTPVGERALKRVADALKQITVAEH